MYALHWPGESLLCLGVPVEVDVSRDGSSRLATREHVEERRLASSRGAHQSRHLFVCVIKKKQGANQKVEPISRGSRARRPKLHAAAGHSVGIVVPRR